MPKPFFRDKLNLSSIIFSLLLNLSIWFILIFKLKRSELPLILHYNAYFGVDYLGKYGKAFVIPIVGLLIAAVNFALSKYLFNRLKLASRMLIISAVIAQVLLAVGAVAVILLNF